MLTAVRNWVIRTMMKSKGQTGVVQTLPKKDLIELNTQITAQKLMQGGIDPNSLKNADQVENAIIAIESRPKVQEGIRSTQSAKVFDLEGKEIKNPKNIMGGKEVKETEAEMLARINEENKKGIEGLKQKMKKEQARSKRISGTLRESNRERFDRIQFGEEKKGPPVKDVDYDYYRELLDYQGDEFSDDISYVVGDETKEMLEAMVKEQKDEMAYMKRLYDKGALDPEDMAQGGRAGYFIGGLSKYKKGEGIVKILKDMFKPKKSKFDKKRFEEGPIDLDFLENLDPKDLGPYLRTRDTGGLGGYGMYDNFADMPAGLRAAELIKTIKTTDGGINYKAAELFLGKRLKGNESVDELIQMLNRQEMRAEGGRIGFKEGMSRRTFLKLLGGLAAVPIIGKFIKPIKVGKKVANVPLIKTDNVPGKPEWFDALVNKVIIEGDNVTKKFATGERQSIHQKTLKDGSVVRVTEDIDDGAVRVEYDSDANMFEDTVQMEYKKPLPDEGNPRPSAEFTTAESGPVGRQSGPDDYDIDIDEVGGTSISDLNSDISILKEYATGKKPTMKEIVEIKKRKDKAKYYESPEGQSDAVIARQGEMLDYDDYASGGIARMLGE